MGMGFVANTQITTPKRAKKMTLDEFMKSAGDKDVNNIFKRVNGGTFMACHVAFYEATGIWIPELESVFQKLDAMLVLRPEIEPQELK